MTPKLPEGNLSYMDISKYVHKFSSQDNSLDDGCTNEAGRKLFIGIKEYLNASFVFLTAMIAVVTIFDHLPDTWNDDVFSDLNDNYSYRRLGRLFHGMITSLATQRRFFGCLKNKIRKNKIDQKWNEILRHDLQKGYRRLDYISSIIKENLSSTPFILYTTYLDANNLSFREDIEKIITDEYGNLIYGDDYETYNSLVRDHILAKMEEAKNDKDLLMKAKNSSEMYAKAVRERKAKKLAEKNNEKEAILNAKKKEAMEILLANIGNMERRFLSSYTTPENVVCEWGGKNNFYLVAIIKVMVKSPIVENKMFFYSGKNGSCLTSKIKAAKRIDSAEEAERIKELVSKKYPNYAVETCKLELYDYFVKHYDIG